MVKNISFLSVYEYNVLCGVFVYIGVYLNMRERML